MPHLSSSYAVDEFLTYTLDWRLVVDIHSCCNASRAGAGINSKLCRLVEQRREDLVKLHENWISLAKHSRERNYQKAGDSWSCRMRKYVAPGFQRHQGSPGSAIAAELSAEVLLDNGKVRHVVGLESALSTVFFGPCGSTEMAQAPIFMGSITDLVLSGHTRRATRMSAYIGHAAAIKSFVLIHSPDAVVEPHRIAKGILLGPSLVNHGPLSMGRSISRMGVNKCLLPIYDDAVTLLPELEKATGSLYQFVRIQKADGKYVGDYDNDAERLRTNLYAADGLGLKILLGLAGKDPAAAWSPQSKLWSASWARVKSKFVKLGHLCRHELIHSCRMPQTSYTALSATVPYNPTTCMYPLHSLLAKCNRLMPECPVLQARFFFCARAVYSRKRQMQMGEQLLLTDELKRRADGDPVLRIDPDEEDVEIGLAAVAQNVNYDIKIQIARLDMLIKILAPARRTLCVVHAPIAARQAPPASPESSTRWYVV
ncbi:uncharacterized protein MYCFIDRAFT_180048 [Pseudocercospora fijiensis CIRAD86]|uniref:Uncharacterized protein n=1 Tax=Pseudocercospora fijiensis (strain CIRAD86) TaxID=383855 RepID=M3AI56_PSEFD|nr:uncharacterized protein MYCFIDRAFT_180048 [Pseudocercospora fijiensis CIRAD86]EME77172.1 hypothetical protein MYCFIDRAFT_180048 [Pseudocercospora fijiensis CIRAD86]